MQVDQNLAHLVLQYCLDVSSSFLFVGFPADYSDTIKAILGCA